VPSKILLEFGCSLIPLSKRQGTFLEPGASHGDASIVLPFLPTGPDLVPFISEKRMLSPRQSQTWGISAFNING